MRVSRAEIAHKGDITLIRLGGGTQSLGKGCETVVHGTSHGRGAFNFDFAMVMHMFDSIHARVRFRHTDIGFW